jgi:hypothetical protein
MTAFRDSVTGQPLLVCNKTAGVVNRALVVAHRTGHISDTEYALAYAEVCEPGRLPQLFGGRTVDPAMVARWQALRAWDDSPALLNWRYPTDPE